MKQISISIEFNTKQQASIIALALQPEIIESIPYTKVSITTKDATLLLKISARQTSTLRAACNSYLRWMQTALSVHVII
jgi:tRNA threonylcarbamoyladenosine modification (KEOPS) complex  Pcc1 subunit